MRKGILVLLLVLFGNCSPIFGHKRLDNQVVIITGATRGIGKGIAQVFASEGAKLVLVGRSEEQLVKLTHELNETGAEAIYVTADVTSEKDMERMAQTALSHFGRIDVLCPNAGIYPMARLETMTFEQWQKVIDVNLTGVFLAMKACIPTMKSQNRGKIVVTSSISGPYTALPGYSHYTASKSGIGGLIRTAAVELAKYNINVNAVEPGNILTEAFEAVGPDHVRNMLRAVPLNRLGTTQDVAYAMLFLATDEASYITGQSIVIDGGQILPETHFADY